MTEKLQKSRNYDALHRPKAASQLPAYPLTGGIGWINNPNGFSPYKGAYHLFLPI